jgi:hypothetical protein
LPPSLIVTLALGIGANTAVFSLVKTALLSPLPYGDAGRLTAIWGADRAEATHLSLREVYTYPRESQSFVDIAGYQEYEASFTGGAEPELIRGGSATPNLFEVTRAQAMLGRTFSPADTAGGTSDVIVISHGLWQRRFGGAADVIGRSIQVNGRARTIIGVMPGGVPITERLRVDSTDRSVGARGRRSCEPRRVGQPIVCGSRAMKRRRVAGSGDKRVVSGGVAMGESRLCPRQT